MSVVYLRRLNHEKHPSSLNHCQDRLIECGPQGYPGPLTKILTTTMYRLVFTHACQQTYQASLRSELLRPLISPEAQLYCLSLTSVSTT